LTGGALALDGAGLGLTLVKELAEAMGGAVAVESTYGDGACFSIWLPLAS
jgi:signal transduction histidine kinase